MRSQTRLNPCSSSSSLNSTSSINLVAKWEVESAADLADEQSFVFDDVNVQHEYELQK